MPCHYREEKCIRLQLTWKRIFFRTKAPISMKSMLDHCLFEFEYAFATGWLSPGADSSPSRGMTENFLFHRWSQRMFNQVLIDSLTSSWRACDYFSQALVLISLSLNSYFLQVVWPQPSRTFTTGPASFLPTSLSESLFVILLLWYEMYLPLQTLRHSHSAIYLFRCCCHVTIFGIHSHLNIIFLFFFWLVSSTQWLTQSQSIKSLYRACAELAVQCFTIVVDEASVVSQQ